MMEVEEETTQSQQRKETAYNKFFKEQELTNTYPGNKKTMRSMIRAKWIAMSKEEQKKYAVKKEDEPRPENDKKRKLTATSTSPFDKYFEETKTQLIEENRKFGFSSDDIRFIAIMKWKSMTDDERKVYFSMKDIDDEASSSKKVRSKKHIPSMKERVLALGDDINGIWSLLQSSFADEIEDWRNNTEPEFSLKTACRKIETKFNLPVDYLNNYRSALKPLVCDLAKSTEQEDDEEEEPLQEQEEIQPVTVKFDTDEDENETEKFDVENAIHSMYCEGEQKK